LGLGLVVAIILSFVASTGVAQKPDDKKPAPAAAPAAKPPAAPAAAAPAAPAAPAAAASAPPMPPPPKPAAELDQLKFFLGKWKCEGKQLATPTMGPEHPIKGAAEAKMDSDNFWQAWTYEEKKSKEHMGFKVHGMWGWDAGTKKFVRAGADNRGTWDTATAPGVEGDKITWTGELSGPMGVMPFHHTFVKKSDKEWMHALEVKGPDGKWIPLEEVTCKR
jgi:hypothetical protein